MTESVKPASMLKILVWALLFQCAWSHKTILDVLVQGALPGSDDFLRLVHVRDWLNGQAWFDSAIHRLGPPNGGNLHWSRLGDLPIAAIVNCLDFFVDRVLAERIASIIWPAILMLATTATILKTCAKLFPKVDPLLILLFIVTCVSSNLEFLPGRIDHHGFQIFLLSLSLLGFAYSEKRWGSILIGSSIAVSMLIGLDTLLLSLLILAWLGLEWAFDLDKHGKNLQGAAIGLIASSTILYPIFVAPDQWLAIVYDANSIVYFTAFWLVGISFLLLSKLSGKISGPVSRIGAGVVLAGGSLLLLRVLFPDILQGPYGMISPKLWENWLSGIVEAKGLIAVTEVLPNIWFSGIGYLSFIAIVGAVLLFRNGIGDGKLLSFYAMFLVCALASFVQMRAMRIGLYSSVPICIWAVQEFFPILVHKFETQKLKLNFAKVVSVVLLSAASWHAVGAAFEVGTAYSSAASVVTSKKSTIGDANAIAWHKEDNIEFCAREKYFEKLSKLPKGLVLSKLNTSPSILVFTEHSALAGNYHRNQKHILDVLNFFKARQKVHAQ